MTHAVDPLLSPLGDAGWLLRWDDRIDAAIVDAVHARAAALRADAPAFVLDLVPAYASLAVLVAPDDSTRAEAWLREALARPAAATLSGGRVVDIRVHYGGEHGPDLDDVASHAGLTADEVVARHAAPLYRVAMLGFAPGFPYLLGLDPRLATPRRAQPRTRVAAGSVGIGGAQTGVYPTAGPGGWQLLGRTDAILFEARRAEPSLLQPGDRVRFVPA